MRKQNLLAITMLATVLLCSVFFALAAAQDGIEDSSTPSSPSLSALPESTVKSDEPQATPSREVPNPDEPVSSGDEILYTIQDDNSTDALVPGAEYSSFSQLL
jgi:hypothetical protein